MGFVEDFRSYMATRSDCPPDFAMHAALVCLSVALGNNVSTHGWGTPLYPNLWVVVLAPSGYGKSVPLRLTETLLQGAGLGNALAPNTFTMEGLVGVLERNPVSLIVQGEFSSFLYSMQRQYNEGLRDWLTDLYDCPAEVKRQLAKKDYKGQVSSGLTVIRKPTLSILSGSTPHWFASAFAEKDLASGFLARFIYCPSTESGPSVGDPGPPDEATENTLSYHLRVASDVNGVFDFRPVREQFNEWDARKRQQLRSDCPPEFTGLRARMGALAKKAAMLFSVSENPYVEDFRITEADLTRAIRYVEWSVTKAEDFLNTIPRGGRIDANCLKVLALLRDAGVPLMRSFVTTRCHISARVMDEVEDTLLETEQIEVGRVKTPGGGKVYVLREQKTNGHFAGSLQDLAPVLAKSYRA